MNEIFTRRSVRSFLDKEVEMEKIDRLVRAGMQAPSAKNQQGWKFAIVNNKEKIVELSKFKTYAAPLANAPLGIIVLGDMDNMDVPHYWQQDLSAAIQNIMLEAVSLELGSGWLGVAPNEEIMDKVSDIIKLDKNLAPLAVLAIGYPSKTDANKFIDRYDESKVIWIK